MSGWAAHVAARPGGPWLLSALLGILLLCGCAAPAQLADDAPSPQASTETSSCEGVRNSAPCASVRVGDREYRYSLVLPAGPSDGEEAVFVDLGGPGRVLFGNTDFVDFAQAWPGNETLIAVEEPWVLTKLRPECKAALAGFYRAVHDIEVVSNSVTTELHSACELSEEGRWGWSTTTYRTVIDKILEVEGLKLTGVVGNSYGASRTAALWNQSNVRWAILNSPSPRRISGTQYLRARGDGALKALRAGCPNCSGKRDERELVNQAAQRLETSPIRLTTRTPIVTSTDAVAAAVSFPYLRSEQRPVALAALRTPSSQRSARFLGALSDSLMLRYGDHDMSPGMLAYFQEVCAAYPSWNSSGQGRVEEFLRNLHAPCSTIAARNEPIEPAPAQVCLAQAQDDQVTPSAFMTGWAQEVPYATAVKKPRGGHASGQLAIDCYRTFDDP